ncbi:MAG: hypothetical protein ACF8Q5_12875 [Phycisphaerales bacterium JB040]
MGMLLALSALLAVLLGIGTLAWWRVGDTWADSEHKKFGPRERTGPGPRVMKPIGEDDSPEPGRHDPSVGTPSPRHESEG